MVFYLLHDIIGAMNYPGYNWLSQAVSDLTATDATSFVIASGYVTVYKIFSCLCCAILCILMKNETNKVLKIGVYMFSVMNFISAIGYAIFPLSSSGFDGSIQSIIHVYILTTLVVLLSIVSLILIAVGSGNVPKECFGIVERFSTYSAVIFTGILGLYGFKVFRD